MSATVRLWATRLELEDVMSADEQSTESFRLPYGAPYGLVQAALDKLGVYISEESDSIDWGAYPPAVASVIYMDSGEPFVHLYDYPPPEVQNALRNEYLAETEFEDPVVAASARDTLTRMLGSGRLSHDRNWPLTMTKGTR